MISISSILYTSRHYLQHLCTVGNQHSLHSPYVYHFYDEVVVAKKQFYAFAPLSRLREKLLRDTRVLEINDWGAGSRVRHKGKRTVGHIAKNSLGSRKKLEFIFNCVHYLRPQTILELGSSLGLSTLYLHKAHEKATIYTLEGARAMANIARDNFWVFGAPIRLIEGNIDEKLLDLLKKIKPPDLVYMDANHQYKPTMQYFNWLLPRLHAQSVVILDDIYWSSQMTKAWRILSKHKKVSYAIDFFCLGILFFHQVKQQQSFKLTIG